MDSELTKILADCIADIEGGAAVEDCLKRNSSQAAELRPHLESWAAMGSVSLAQPGAAGFERGRVAMLGALQPVSTGFGPFSIRRFTPAWATVAAVTAAAVILLGGAAGTSAALGGPDVAGDVFDAVGVTDGGGISHSSASDRGLACANPNAFEGSANSEDKGQNAEDAADKSCDDEGEGDTAAAAEDGCEDANEGHGNDADHDDEDNPGQGEGNHGTDEGASGDEASGDETSLDECTVVEGDAPVEGDEDKGHGNSDHDDQDNPGQGEGNHGTGNNGSGQENSSANGTGGNSPNNGNSANPEENGNGGNEPQGQGTGGNKD